MLTEPEPEGFEEAELLPFGVIRVDARAEDSLRRLLVQNDMNDGDVAILLHSYIPNHQADLKHINDIFAKLDEAFVSVNRVIGSRKREFTLRRDDFLSLEAELTRLVRMTESFKQWRNDPVRFIQALLIYGDRRE
jgi:hypothetical protein